MRGSAKGQAPGLPLEIFVLRVSFRRPERDQVASRGFAGIVLQGARVKEVGGEETVLEARHRKGREQGARSKNKKRQQEEEEEEEEDSVMKERRVLSVRGFADAGGHVKDALFIERESERKREKRRVVGT